VETAYQHSSGLSCSRTESGRPPILVKPDLRGLFGETAIHWVALLGEDRTVAELIGGSNVNLKDEKYKSPPLGWAIHGWCEPPAGNIGRQRDVVAARIAKPHLRHRRLRGVVVRHRLEKRAANEPMALRYWADLVAVALNLIMNPAMPLSISASASLMTSDDLSLASSNRTHASICP
jgi:hypothetical protein